MTRATLPLALFLTLLLAGMVCAEEPMKSKVYFTKDISPAGLQKVYEALGRKPHGKVAVKVSTGEAGNNHYLKAALIGEFVKSTGGDIVECNTAYGGSRASTAMHYQVAKDHGFTSFAKVVIMDEDGDMDIPVKNGKHLERDIVGKHFTDYDFHIVLSHFKGHAMGGFGGALKNMSIGYGSSRGKTLIHSAGESDSDWGNPKQDDFLESMAEAASAIVDKAGKDNFLYINVLNNLSVDCDCDGNPHAPTQADIGIMASLDPVALDRASLDMAFGAPDSKDLKQRVQSLNGEHTVSYAAQRGLGSLEYELVEIDGATPVLGQGGHMGPPIPMFFDIRGNRVNGTPQTPGVYIVRQGSQTKTIVVR
jgi:uncharacterized Fe-S center protein